MKKVLLAALLGAVLTSCGEYFDLMGVTDPALREQILWLAGGGKVSSDAFNDITPFVYSYNVTGKKYLFFASDRGGNYDIYYAVMNVDGSFQKPSPLNSTINTTSREISPILCDANGTNYISFLRISGGSTNLMSYRVGAGFSSFSVDQNTPVNYRHISVVRISGSPMFIAANGSAGIDTSSPGTSTPLWAPFLGWTINTNISGIAGIYSAALSNNYLLQTTGNKFTGHSHGGSVAPFSYYYPTPAYLSDYNDITPFIDPDTYQVYMASDRAGNGKFNLYRYNHFLFIDQIP